MAFRLFSSSGNVTKNIEEPPKNNLKKLEEIDNSEHKKEDVEEEEEDEEVNGRNEENKEDTEDGGVGLGQLVTSINDTVKERKDVVSNSDQEEYVSSEESEESSEMEAGGVVWIGRIPAGMREERLLSILGSFGSIQHSHFEVEDRKRFKKRSKAGIKHNYRRLKEGWVEYDDPDLAERVAASMNCTPMEHVTSKRSKVKKSYLWTIKHIPYFRWSDLDAQKTHDSTVRSMRLQKACCAVTKQNERYMAHVYEEQYEKTKKGKKRQRAGSKGEGNISERGRGIDPSFMDKFPQRAVIHNRQPRESDIDIDPHLLRDLL